jgi:hypothetical protein
VCDITAVSISKPAGTSLKKMNCLAPHPWAIAEAAARAAPSPTLGGLSDCPSIDACSNGKNRTSNHSQVACFEYMFFFPDGRSKRCAFPGWGIMIMMIMITLKVLIAFSSYVTRGKRVSESPPLCPSHSGGHCVRGEAGGGERGERALLRQSMLGCTLARDQARRPPVQGPTVFKREREREREYGCM